MTILNYTTEQFFKYLKDEGAEKFADYPDDDIVVYEFQDFRIPIQIRTIYYPCYVVKICEALKIPCPPDFKKVATQLEQARTMGSKKKKDE